MSLFALITALLLEQLHPLSSRKYLHDWLTKYVLFFLRHFNTGQRKHGKIAWLLAVVPLLTGVAIFSWWLCHVHPALSLVFNVLVLYLTMGFRQFSHYFTDIHQALRDGQLDQARRLLTQWRGVPAHEFNTEQVVRVTIEESLLASHRNVFGIIVWFVLFSVLGLGGATGALLYRLGQFLRTYWYGYQDAAIPGGLTEDEKSVACDLGNLGAQHNEFGDFAQRAFYLLEWLPIRLTAMTFAIVGNFEDTAYCWRTQAANWPDREIGILLASGAGALGVRLGMPVPQGGMPLDRPELGVGDDADTGHMQSTIGLVWRSVVFWLILLLLLTLASLIG